jgi:hypothetical protein
MRVEYRVVVEEQERDDYAAVIDPAKLLVLDKSYQRAYDTFDDRQFGVGSGAARNFAWEHSIAEGHAWHWLMDDNIMRFFRMNDNTYGLATDGTIFRCMEDFVLRYENVAQAGPNYFMFAPRKSVIPPFVLNTRIYSCLLIRNDIPFRWRGRWNEDTDLSLRILKEGWCTVQFNAFLQDKMVTQTLAGGNTEDYKKAGTMVKSKMLVAMHPDVAEVAQRWGRWHHHVDYSRFRNNRLIRKPGMVVPRGANEYGMRLVLSERDRARIDSRARSSPNRSTSG